MAPQLPQLWAGSGRLVVRHTFLDVVEASSDDEEAQPGSVRRSLTDPSLWRRSVHEQVTDDREGGEAPIKPPHSARSSSAGESMCSTSLPVAEHGEVSDADERHHASAAVASVEPYSAAACVADGAWEAADHAEGRTTLMLRNLPNNYTRDMLLQMLDEAGFSGCFDFLYLPIDFARGCGLGYAFINVVRPDLVPKMWAAFDGFTDWAIPTSKVCEVTWSHPHQGLKANVRRYRNSPVMHPSVPQEYKPVLFENGKQVLFPVATRPVGRPQRRKA